MQTLATRRNELDDRGIELLEGSSAADEELVALADREDRAASAESVLLEHRLRAEGEADRALADLLSERAAMVAAIAPEDLAEYERRRKAFGGIAVSRIDHGMCTGCRMDISVAELDSIKRQPAEAGVECPNCNRLLLR
jgi:predicted  nucleic acid-binding Zn-ribbon protein